METVANQIYDGEVTTGGWSLRILGLLSLSFFLIHGICQLENGTPENLLWACHAAALLVGIGLLLRSRTINSIGVLILAVGVPSWLMNLLVGGKFYPTSILTHIGGLACGIAGMLILGLDRGGRTKALTSFVYLLVLSRVLTPPATNVNLAFDTWSILKPYVTSIVLHFVLMLLIWAILLWMAEHFLRVAIENPWARRSRTSAATR